MPEVSGRPGFPGGPEHARMRKPRGGCTAHTSGRAVGRCSARGMPEGLALIPPGEQCPAGFHDFSMRAFLLHASPAQCWAGPKALPQGQHARSSASGHFLVKNPCLDGFATPARRPPSGRRVAQIGKLFSRAHPGPHLHRTTPSTAGRGPCRTRIRNANQHLQCQQLPAVASPATAQSWTSPCICARPRVDEPQAAQPPWASRRWFAREMASPRRSRARQTHLAGGLPRVWSGPADVLKKGGVAQAP